MHLRSERVLPPSSTRRVNPNREPIPNKDCMVLIGHASLVLPLLKAIYQCIDETTRQKGPTQSFSTMNTHRNPSLDSRTTHSNNNREREETPTRLEDVNLEDVSVHFL